MKCDIVIAGGGLAGASLGMALAARGARVVIVEHQPRSGTVSMERSRIPQGSLTLYIASCVERWAS